MTSVGAGTRTYLTAAPDSNTQMHRVGFRLIIYTSAASTPSATGTPLQENPQ